MSDQLWDSILKTSQFFNKKDPSNSQMARHILSLSDKYQTKFVSHSDVWQSAAHTAAYINYNLPLNALRTKAVLELSQFSTLLNENSHIYDYGSGPGTTQLALGELDINYTAITNVEIAKKPIDIHKKLLQLNPDIPKGQTHWSAQFPKVIKKNSVAIFNYSFNELPEWPENILDFETILIIEPSTQDVTRRLQEQRDKFVTKGYHCHAPCTHDLSCPLLKFSKTDWCHSRIFFHSNPRLDEFEKHLPIKNTSLTFSYLLLSKKPRSQNLKNTVRIIGDTLREKGKTRQAICRGEKREFLAWLKRDFKKPAPLERGHLYQVPESHEVKGQEIRIKNSLK